MNSVNYTEDITISEKLRKTPEERTINYTRRIINYTSEKTI